MSLGIRTGSGTEKVWEVYVKTAVGAEALGSLYVKTASGAEVIWRKTVAGRVYINVATTPNLRVYDMATLALLRGDTMNVQQLGLEYSLAAVEQRLFAVSQNIPAGQEGVDLFEVDPRNFAILNAGRVTPTQRLWLGGNAKGLYLGSESGSASVWQLSPDTLANLGVLSLSNLYGAPNYLPTGGTGSNLLVGSFAPTGYAYLLEYSASGTRQRTILDLVRGSALGDSDGESLVVITEANRKTCTKIKYSEYVVLGSIVDLPAAATNPAVLQ